MWIWMNVVVWKCRKKPDISCVYSAGGSLWLKSELSFTWSCAHMQTREPILSAHLALRHKSNNEQAASTALHITEEIHPELSENPILSQIYGPIHCSRMAIKIKWKVTVLHCIFINELPFGAHPCPLLLPLNQSPNSLPTACGTFSSVQSKLFFPLWVIIVNKTDLE